MLPKIFLAETRQQFSSHLVFVYPV